MRLSKENTDSQFFQCLSTLSLANLRLIAFKINIEFSNSKFKNQEYIQYKDKSKEELIGILLGKEPGFKISRTLLLSALGENSLNRFPRSKFLVEGHEIILHRTRERQSHTRREGDSFINLDSINAIISESSTRGRVTRRGGSVSSGSVYAEKFVDAVLDDPQFDTEDDDIFLQLNDSGVKFSSSAEEERKQLHNFQINCVRDLKERYSRDNVSKRGYLYIATGGGKTLITNQFIWENYLSKGKRVLWIANNWHLLYQAALGFIQRFGNETKVRNYEDFMAYYASSHNSSDVLLKRYLRSFKDRYLRKPPSLLYSTHQTIGPALSDDSTALRNWDCDLVVVDEAHWGKYGSHEKALYDHLIIPGKKNVLGLSATPKVRFSSDQKWERKHIGNYGFPILVKMRHLARPILHSVELKCKVKLTKSSAGSLNYSLISANRERNREIYREYMRNKSIYGKTLIFCCSVEHADNLGREFQSESTVVIHSQVESPEMQIERFRKGDFKIALVVNMAKEGIDIPDLNTVFLCKPVTSQIEFAQMIGRGARKYQEKDHFHIVDFFDNLDNQEISRQIVHFQEYFSGSDDRDAYQTRSYSGNEDIFKIKRPHNETFREHSFEPRMTDIVAESNSPLEILQLDNFRINGSQTFGIEFELTSIGEGVWKDARHWNVVAGKIAEVLRKVFGNDKFGEVIGRGSVVKNIDYSKWNVVFDGSCGWEIVTPILKGVEGFRSVVVFLKVFNELNLFERLGLEANFDQVCTSTHVHFGWNFAEPTKVRRILHFMRIYEPAFASLVAPSRVVVGDAPNQYCLPYRLFDFERVNSIKKGEDISVFLGNQSDRYRTLNLSNFDKNPQRVEVRFHHGTVDSVKILSWISLWMNVFGAIDNLDIVGLESLSRKTRKGLPFPNDSCEGDIVDVAVNVLQLGNYPEMLEAFHMRRKEVIGGTHWRTVLGNEKVDSLLNYWQKRFEAIVSGNQRKRAS